MKNVSYDNIKSHKKPELYLIYGKYSFGKTTGEVKLTNPSLTEDLQCLLLSIMRSKKVI